ncbi:MAG: hypothetical protein CMI57_02745 [Parcubacteria group bacterium]|jgi:N-acetyl sugar amidotransferase|nr:hypothetical protein [Parcubacteria group bacterium]
MALKICNRCIIDESVSGTSFDKKGICNYCKTHDILDKLFPINDKFLDIIEKIKKDGSKGKYDCIVGLSGGRDSTFTLYLVKKYGLRPLAVHFNDGFGNPVSGLNMKKALEKTGVELRTITSDWRESKDIKIATLKASVPDLEVGTDLGIANALYGTATKENIKYILSGTSFRTEGIAPLEWNYLDGKYLKSIIKKHGTVKLRKWSPNNPGFNLEVKHILYYTIYKRIKMVPILYYYNYNRQEAENIIKEEFDWINTGAHYYDDLYQSLMANILRIKFNIDFRKFIYSALVRSKQMDRSDALERIKKVYTIEDPKVIDLCIKRLGLTLEQYEKFNIEKTKTFRDYNTNYDIIKFFKIPIKILSKLNFFHPITYYKFFGDE